MRSSPGRRWLSGGSIPGRRARADPEGLIREPIVILAAPRSGSSSFFAALSAHPDLWSRYRESNRLLEGPYHPAALGWRSNALTEEDLDPARRAQLLRAFYATVGNLERLPLGRHLPLRGRGRRRVSELIALASGPLKRPPIRIVEKSPKNTLRIRFVRALFPDARFVHLVRDPRPNIASLYRAWRIPDRYKTYPLPAGFTISGYDGTHWSFVLQPGWRELQGRRLIEICADQWRACNEACLEDLASLPSERVLRLRFEDLVARPTEVLGRVASWAELDPEPFARFSWGLPVIQARTPPDERKWISLREEVEGVLPHVRDVAAALGYYV